MCDAETLLDLLTYGHVNTCREIISLYRDLQESAACFLGTGVERMRCPTYVSLKISLHGYELSGCGELPSDGCIL